MNNYHKLKFKKFCESNSDLPIFLTYNWYQSLFQNNWDVILIENNGEVKGILLYTLTKKKTFLLIRPPMLTPYQGVWFNYPKDQKYTNRLSFEKKVINLIVDKLPNAALFEQKFLPEFTNWLPFYWLGFQQTTQYTYIIKDLSNLKSVFASFRENIRREIRKAEKKLTIQNGNNIEQLFSLKEHVYVLKNEKYPISLTLLQRAFDFCVNNNCGELLLATDKKGNVHAMLLYVWDKNSAYYLHGATANEFKTTGAISFLLWEAIQRSAKKTKAFNFEGSMNESVERFFRAFGGKQCPYFVINKINSKLLKLLNH